jgi:hydroxymethylpyrimidine/phosphomethylpyrimidine kinase
VERRYARALTIAGSDSGGGAGIQADLKTFAALGCYGMSVVTVLTAQNTAAVTGIHEVPPKFITAQFEAVMEDIGADAIKIGMLHSAEVIVAVAGGLRRYPQVPVVLDPVMVAKSGDRLLREDAVTALREVLLPLATVVTPNLPEAETLLGRRVRDRDAMNAAAIELLRLGPRAVVVKGGHLAGGDSADVLALAGEKTVRWFQAPRAATANIHGTGCTYSSAIAAGLARGASIADAVEQAKRYLTGAITAGATFKLGSGHGPVHHFHALWPSDSLERGRKKE